MIAISFVIANYNYVHYVGQSIESALASDWPDIEVIVVDDGSTDGSHEVIESFGDRITKIYQKNGRQRVANNTGFAASRGGIIVFLDADDLVAPSFAREVASVWRPGVTKIQVQMMRIDGEGRPFGSPFPNWQEIPTPEQIRQWTMSTSEYPTPPGSGNAYSRDFLQRFFPVGEEHDSFTDSTTLPLAPILGDVITVRKPLVSYRRHGSNDSHLLSDDGHFAREVARAMKRQWSATKVCGELHVQGPPDDILRRSWYVLQLRVASMRLRPETHPLPGDNRLVALTDAVQNIILPGAEPIKKRLLIAAWSIVTLIAPQSLARRLIVFRFGERS
jgi:glycosyltransferase involved in cell wall biosynthesis